MSTVPARTADTVRCVDPVRNPFAPGAGQRPPELAGRDRELDAFEIVLERTLKLVASGREKLQATNLSRPEDEFGPEAEPGPVDEAFFDQNRS